MFARKENNNYEQPAVDDPIDPERENEVEEEKKAEVEEP